jgi:uncharacterized protein YkwD
MRRTEICRLPLLIAALALSWIPGAAYADPLSGVNTARLRECAAGYLRPLHRNQTLDTVARRLADGASLHEALQERAYGARSASSLHLAGAADDTIIERSLASRYCRELVQPGIEEYGGFVRGQELWIVLAAPLVAPSAYDARAEALRALELVNYARSSPRRCGARTFAPAPALRLETALSAAAFEHSRDMARRSFFEHSGSDGSTAADRVRRSGYAARAVGENLAAGVVNAREAVDGWLASPGHCANIMDPRFTAMGIAFASNPASASAVYWTQELAAPR